MDAKFKVLLVCAVFAVVAAFYYAFKQGEIRHFEGFIPGAIGLSGVEEAGSESYFRGGCGVAVFRLSDGAARQIDAEGLHFFDQATDARDRDHHPITYLSWKRTPVPLSWTSEGSWFDCSVVDGAHDREIVDAAKWGGAYYTTAGNVKLVVIPARRLVSISYYD